MELLNDFLEYIFFQYTGIDERELTTLERNILAKAKQIRATKMQMEDAEESIGSPHNG